MNQQNHLITVPTIEDLKRREFLSSALAAGLLIACGSDDDEQALTPQAPATRMFTDSTGTTSEVPVRPQRVVATHDLQAAIPALALGAPVVGMGSWWPSGEFPAYLTDYFDLQEVEMLGWGAEIDVEAVLALEPDLIIVPVRSGAYPLEEALMNRLRAIAPTVGIDQRRPIEEYTADYADLLGVDAGLVAQQRSEFEAALADLRAFRGEAWSDVTVGNLWMLAGQDVSLWGSTAQVPNDIATRVGAKWIDLAREADANSGFMGGISLERLGEFECDLLLLTVVSENHLANPLFQGLEVVKAGQVIRFGNPSPLAGPHYRSYTACARFMLAELRQMTGFRSDIV